MATDPDETDSGDETCGRMDENLGTAVGDAKDGATVPDEKT